MTVSTVREARDRFLADNGLDVGRYSARWFVTRVGFVPLVFPNPKLLHLHDLHHVVTGFATSVVGEAEISAFELRAGCRTWLIRFLCVGAIFFAFFVAPRRIVRSFRRSRGTRSLYFDPRPYDALLAMPLVELRATLGVPAEGLAP